MKKHSWQKKSKNKKSLRNENLKRWKNSKNQIEYDKHKIFIKPL